jgi:hypothetical protein
MRRLDLGFKNFGILKASSEANLPKNAREAEYSTVT